MIRYLSLLLLDRAAFVLTLIGATLFVLGRELYLRLDHQLARSRA